MRESNNKHSMISLNAHNENQRHIRLTQANDPHICHTQYASHECTWKLRDSPFSSYENNRIRSNCGANWSLAKRLPPYPLHAKRASVLTTKKTHGSREESTCVDKKKKKKRAHKSVKRCETSQFFPRRVSLFFADAKYTQ